MKIYKVENFEVGNKVVPTIKTISAVVGIIKDKSESYGYYIYWFGLGYGENWEDSHLKLLEG